MIKYLATNNKTKEVLHVDAKDEDTALLIVSSASPIGGGWDRKDVTLEKLDKEVE